RIAERHPGLRLVIDHMGLRSGTKGEQAFAGLAEVCGLARYENVAVKASALPCYSIEAYPFRDVQPHSSPRVRRVWAATDVLGNGLDSASLSLAPGGDALHRRASLAFRRRQGMDHGPSHLRMARLAYAPRRQLASQARLETGRSGVANTGFSIRSTSDSAPSVG